MIIDTVTKSIQVVLGEGHTTRPAVVVASWKEQSSGSYKGGNTNVATNGVTAVTAVAPPSTALVNRELTELRIYNADTVTHTITLQIYDASTASTWIVGPAAVSVVAGATFVYTQDAGITVSSGSATGPASGDLSGNYPSPTVASINGQPLGSTAAGAGALLVGSGAAWVSKAITGDWTLSAGGAAVVVSINGVALGSTTATAGNLLIGSGTQWVTHAATGDWTITSAGATTVAKVNGVSYGTSPATNTFPLVTGANTVTYTATSQIPGSTTNDSASAGNIGEFFSSTVLAGAAVSVSASGTATNVTSIAPTGGDWDVFGNMWTNPAGSTTTSNTFAWISQSSAAFPTPPNSGAYATSVPATSAGANNGLTVGSVRQSLTTTTTIYLSGTAVFAVSTNAVYGFIGARRRR